MPLAEMNDVLKIEKPQRGRGVKQMIPCCIGNLDEQESARGQLAADRSKQRRERDKVFDNVRKHDQIGVHSREGHARQGADLAVDVFDSP